MQKREEQTTNDKQTTAGRAAVNCRKRGKCPSTFLEVGEVGRRDADRKELPESADSRVGAESKTAASGSENRRWKTLGGSIKMSACSFLKCRFINCKMEMARIKNNYDKQNVCLLWEVIF